ITRARELPALAVFEDDVAEARIDDTAVTLRLAGGRSIAAQLAIGADGRRSLCRGAAGIGAEGWCYPQTALTFNLAHSRPHHDISTEFPTEAGPFTLLPLPGPRSSLVFVFDPAAADRTRAPAAADLSAEIERGSHSILGKIEVEPGRGVFPLAVETARSFGGRRIALVGEAAHVLPPIGAQGLNLGLRDAA